MLARMLLTGLLVLGLGEPLTAQEPAGRWHVTWAQAIRVTGGAVEVTGWGEAVLELRREGEQVSGTWVRLLEDRPIARWTVEGTLREGRLELMATEREALDPAVAGDLARVESLHWEATLEDDRFVGEMWLVVPDFVAGAARRPWSAERKE